MSSIFGGGGGGGNNPMLMLALAQQSAQLTNTQGQQLAMLSKSQATADNETASLSKPGLGRAMLSYSGGRDRAQTLGG